MKEGGYCMAKIMKSLNGYEIMDDYARTKLNNTYSKPEVDDLMSSLNTASTSENITRIGNIKKESIPMMISFTDDDCRKETYDRIFPIVQNTGIPYALACPPGNLTDPKYAGQFVTVEQLKEMYNYEIDGNRKIDITCHHKKQYNMDAEEWFPTVKDYENDLIYCNNQFKEWGINDVKAISYPQGRRRTDYMGPVEQHYHMGFTVDKGINHIPYETYHMKRVEVFSDKEAVKTVDVEISEEGQIYEVYDISNTGYNSNCYISSTGTKRSVTSNANGQRILSFNIDVKAGEKYLLTCSAIYQNALFIVGTPTQPKPEDPNDEDAIRTYQAASITPHETVEPADTTNPNPQGLKTISNINTAKEGDTVLTDYEITIKQDGVLVVSSDLSIQPEGFIVKKVNEAAKISAETIKVPELAKGYVDQLIKEGGWLVFMTHAWYDYFNKDHLENLIRYIKYKGIDIVGVNEAIKKTGNIIDIGRFDRNTSKAQSPFCLVDSEGKLWTNAINIVSDEYDVSTQNEYTYFTKTVVTQNGTIKYNENSEIERTVSPKIPVKAGEEYLLTCSAIYQNALYIIGTPIEGSSNNIAPFEGAYRIPLTNTDAKIEGNTVLTDYRVIIPADGVMYVSCDKRLLENGFVIKKVKKEIPIKYIPENVPKLEIAEVGDIVVVKKVDKQGKPIEWENSNVLNKLSKQVPDYIETEIERVVGNVYNNIPENADIFIMCADTHYEENKTGYIDYTIPAIKSLANMLEPNAVCILGDEITGSIKKNNALKQLGKINSTLKGFDIPVIRALGNHDYNSGYDEANSQMLSKAILDRHFNDNTYVDTGNTRLICVRSVYPNAPQRWGFDEETLNFVEDALDTADRMTCICFSHVPAYRDGNGGSWIPNLQEEMSEIIETFIRNGGKFAGWYCGHAHYERFGTPEGKMWHMNFLATAQEKNITPDTTTCDNGAVGYTDRLNGDAKRLLFYVVVVSGYNVNIYHVGSGSDYSFKIPVLDSTLLSSLPFGTIVQLPRKDGSTTPYLFVGSDANGQSILVDTVSRGNTIFGSGENGSLESIKYIGSMAESKANSVKALYLDELFGSVTFEHDCAGEYTETVTSGYFPIWYEDKKIKIGNVQYMDMTDHFILKNINGDGVKYWTLDNKLQDELYKSHFIKNDGSEGYSTNTAVSDVVFRGIAIIKADAKVTEDNVVYM